MRNCVKVIVCPLLHLDYLINVHKFFTSNPKTGTFLFPLRILSGII